VIVFKIDTGQYFADGVLIGTGYAGAPPYVNDPTATALVDQGPIPTGLYTIGPAEDRPQDVGLFALPLIPETGTDMLGRDPSSFFCHGANATKDLDGQRMSSHGCPIAQLTVRNQIAQHQTMAVVP
jgi:hypothetical protein